MYEYDDNHYEDLKEEIILLKKELSKLQNKNRIKNEKVSKIIGKRSPSHMLTIMEKLVEASGLSSVGDVKDLSTRDITAFLEDVAKRGKKN